MFRRLYLILLLVSTNVYSFKLSYDQLHGNYTIKFSTESLNIKALDLYKIQMTRRNTEGDRLGARLFWDQDFWSTSNYSVSKTCFDEYGEVFRTGEFITKDIESFSHILMCFNSQYYKTMIKTRIHENRSLFLKYQSFANKILASYRTNQIFLRSFLIEVLRPLNDLDNKIISYTHPYDLKAYSDREFSSGVIVTHGNSYFDRQRVVETAINQEIQEHNKIIFLNDNNDFYYWYADSVLPTETLFSKWGEHNYTFKNEVTIVGGQWGRCLRVSVVDAITRHFNKYDNDLKVILPIDAIYTYDNETLEEKLSKMSNAELIQEVLSSTFFGGYRIPFEDHGYISEIDNDMNLYTGVPDLSEYSYEIKYLGESIANSPRKKKHIILDFSKVENR